MVAHLEYRNEMRQLAEIALAKRVAADAAPRDTDDTMILEMEATDAEQRARLVCAPAAVLGLFADLEAARQQREDARREAFEEAADICDQEATIEGVAQRCAARIRALAAQAAPGGET